MTGKQCVRSLPLPIVSVAVSAACLAALLWRPIPLRAEIPRPPNILLIVSDDQGYHDLGCFGNDEIKTPHEDRLAQEGVRLTNFYVTWPACTPSRGSLLTGRYPQRNGMYDLSTDVGEKHDLSAGKPEVLAMLKARFAAWKQAMDAAEPRGPFRDY